MRVLGRECVCHGLEPQADAGQRRPKSVVEVVPDAFAFLESHLDSTVALAFHLGSDRDRMEGGPDLRHQRRQNSPLHRGTATALPGRSNPQQTDLIATHLQSQRLQLVVGHRAGVAHDQTVRSDEFHAGGVQNLADGSGEVTGQLGEFGPCKQITDLRHGSDRIAAIAVQQAVHPALHQIPHGQQTDRHHGRRDECRQAGVSRPPSAHPGGHAIDHDDTRGQQAIDEAAVKHRLDAEQTIAKDSHSSGRGQTHQGKSPNHRDSVPGQRRGGQAADLRQRPLAHHQKSPNAHARGRQSPGYSAWEGTGRIEQRQEAEKQEQSEAADDRQGKSHDARRNEAAAAQGLLRDADLGRGADPEDQPTKPIPGTPQDDKRPGDGPGEQREVQEHLGCRRATTGSEDIGRCGHDRRPERYDGQRDRQLPGLHLAIIPVGAPTHPGSMSRSGRDVPPGTGGCSALSTRLFRRESHG